MKALLWIACLIHLLSSCSTEFQQKSLYNTKVRRSVILTLTSFEEHATGSLTYILFSCVSLISCECVSSDCVCCFPAYVEEGKKSIHRNQMCLNISPNLEKVCLLVLRLLQLSGSVLHRYFSSLSWHRN